MLLYGGQARPLLPEEGLVMKKLVVLAVPDRYKRLDPELIQIIKTQYEETTK